ncbi:hypothetical protein [Craterilacuibacter sp.]|uniref:hypothetical protein n=1 Tax=Craterilacuibacter sp. TaxID=2870909 RepID=UPI003F2C4D68
MESVAALAAQAQIQSESIIVLSADGDAVYAVLRKLRTQTALADYFRVQLRAHSSARGMEWTVLQGDEAHWHDTCNYAEVWVDHGSSSIGFGPNGGVQASAALSSKGIAAYLFAQTILWAKNHYPDYSVKSGLLHPEEAASEEMRLRRNGYYATQGFDFEWFDIEQRSGRYFKSKVSQLLGVWASETIQTPGCEHLLDTLASQDAQRVDLENRLSRARSGHEHASQKLERERMLNLILTGVTCFVLVMGLMAALRV